MILILMLIFNFIYCDNYDIRFARDLVYKYTKSLNFNLLENYPNVDNLGFDESSLFQGEAFILKNFLKNDDIVFDVGANIGEWSEKVLKLNLNCLIYAFEPAPQVFEKFLKFQNNNTSLIPFNFGFGIKDDILKFYYLPNMDYMSSIYLRQSFNILDQKVDEIIVSIKTIDDFVKNNKINKINYLKIDTEGSEYNVLMGANKSIKNGIIDIIQFEYGGCYLDAEKKLFDVYHFLKANNYLVFRIISNGLIYIENWNDSLENYTWSNYLAIKIS